MRQINSKLKVSWVYVGLTKPNIFFERGFCCTNDSILYIAFKISTKLSIWIAKKKKKKKVGRSQTVSAERSPKVSEILHMGRRKSVGDQSAFHQISNQIYLTGDSGENLPLLKAVQLQLANPNINNAPIKSISCTSNLTFVLLENGDVFTFKILSNNSCSPASKLVFLSHNNQLPVQIEQIWSSDQVIMATSTTGEVFSIQPYPQEVSPVSNIVKEMTPYFVTEVACGDSFYLMLSDHGQVFASGKNA